jgi:hypothetical protein
MVKHLVRPPSAVALLRRMESFESGVFFMSPNSVLITRNCLGFRSLAHTLPDIV